MREVLGGCDRGYDLPEGTLTAFTLLLWNSADQFWTVRNLEMPYHKSTEAEREAVLIAAERGDDFILVGASLGIRRSTLYLWVQQLEQSGRRRGKPPGGPHHLTW